jgi:hypothetical protein
MSKIYYYVDESGQHTQGDFFSVAVVIVNATELRDEIERRLLDIEIETGKGIVKWTHTSYEKKENYLQSITTIAKLEGTLFYSIHINTRDYVSATVETIAQVAQQLTTDTEKYKLTVIVDGLSKKEKQQIAKQLRKKGVVYKKVRGARDENSAWIRLADAIAGFSRDVYEDKPYTQNLYSEMQQKGFFIRL